MKNNEPNPLNGFVWIELEKTHEDTVTIGGKELYMDTRFEHYHYARQHGIAYKVSPEIKDIKPGDRVYCHHFISRRDHKVNFLENEKLIHKIHKNFIYCLVRDEKLIMLDNWVLVEQVRESEDDCKTDSGIWFKANPDEEEFHGILRHSNQELLDQGCKIGDRVIFSENSEYEMEIEGEKLMRMRTEDVLATINI